MASLFVLALSMDNEIGIRFQEDNNMAFTRADLIKFLTFTEGKVYGYDVLREKCFSVPDKNHFNDEYEDGYPYSFVMANDERSFPLDSVSYWGIEEALEQFADLPENHDLAMAYRSSHGEGVKKILRGDRRKLSAWIKYYATKEKGRIDEMMDYIGVEPYEADKEDYAELKGMLEKFYSLKAWEKFSDHDIVHLKDHNGDSVYFVIMGNAGRTFGLSIYWGPDALNYIRSMMNREDVTHDDAMIVMHEQQVMTFYFDLPGDVGDDDIEFAKKIGFDNFLDGNILLTSIRMRQGTMWREFLRKEDCLRAIDWINMLIQNLAVYLQDPTHHDAFEDNFLFLRYLKTKGTFTIKNEHGLLSGVINPLVHFEKQIIPMPVGEKKPGGEYFADIRSINRLFGVGNDRRIACVIYIIFLVKKDTGEIVFAAMESSGKPFHFYSLGDQVAGFFAKNGISRCITVTSMIAYNFFQELFYDQPKEVELAISEKPIPELDEAFLGLEKISDEALKDKINEA